MHPIVTVVLAAVVLAAVVLGVQYFTKKKKKEPMYIPSPAQFKAAKIPVPPSRECAKKRVRWAPSPVDATNDPRGEWDTNRNPSSFVTNVSPDFPVPADSATIPDGLTWKTRQRASPMPDATFRTGFADPAVGGEYQFDGLFGKV
jgi:hypothetical protein